MERSKRLYDQRRSTYLDLGRFLERQRLMLEGEERDDDAPPLEAMSADEWAELQAQDAVTCSAEAAAKLSGYFEARAMIASLDLRIADPTQRPPTEEQEHTARGVALTTALDAIAEVERTMRDELEQL